VRWDRQEKEKILGETTGLSERMQSSCPKNLGRLFWANLRRWDGGGFTDYFSLLGYNSKIKIFCRQRTIDSGEKTGTHPIRHHPGPYKVEGGR